MLTHQNPQLHVKSTLKHHTGNSNRNVDLHDTCPQAHILIYQNEFGTEKKQRLLTREQVVGSVRKNDRIGIVLRGRAKWLAEGVIVYN